MKTFLALLTLLTTLSFSTAYACSCEEWTAENLEQNIKDYDAAFVGYPLAKSTVYKKGKYLDTMKTRFQVIQKFKGNLKDQTDLISEEDDGASCGIDFEKKDGVYFVLAEKRRDGKYETNGCATLGLAGLDLQSIKDALANEQ